MQAGTWRATVTALVVGLSGGVFGCSAAKEAKEAVIVDALVGSWACKEESSGTDPGRWDFRIQRDGTWSAMAAGSGDESGSWSLNGGDLSIMIDDGGFSRAEVQNADELKFEDGTVDARFFAAEDLDPDVSEEVNNSEEIIDVEASVSVLDDDTVRLYEDLTIIVGGERRSAENDPDGTWNTWLCTRS